MTMALFMLSCEQISAIGENPGNASDFNLMVEKGIRFSDVNVTGDLGSFMQDMQRHGETKVEIGSTVARCLLANVDWRWEDKFFMDAHFDDRAGTLKRDLEMKYMGENYEVTGGDLDIQIPDTVIPVSFRNSLGLKSSYRGDNFGLKVFASKRKGKTTTEDFIGDGTCGPIFLSEHPVLSGSERLEVDDSPLLNGFDYTIDYPNGTITFNEPVEEDVKIVIMYDYENLWDVAKESMYGANVNYRVNKKLSMGQSFAVFDPGMAGKSEERIMSINLDSSPFPWLSFRGKVDQSETNSEPEIGVSSRGQALETRFGLKIPQSFFDITYKQVDPDFSVPASNINTDRRFIQINGRISRWENADVTLNYKNEENNLFDDPAKESRRREEKDVRIAKKYFLGKLCNVEFAGEEVRTSSSVPGQNSVNNTFQVEAKYRLEKALLTGDLEYDTMDNNSSPSAEWQKVKAGIRAKTKIFPAVIATAGIRGSQGKIPLTGRSTPEELDYILNVESRLGKSLSYGSKNTIKTIRNATDDSEISHISSLSLRRNGFEGNIKYELKTTKSDNEYINKNSILSAEITKEIVDRLQVSCQVKRRAYSIDSRDLFTSVLKAEYAPRNNLYCVLSLERHTSNDSDTDEEIYVGDMVKGFLRLRL